MESDGRLKQEEKERTDCKSNGGGQSKGNGGKTSKSNSGGQSKGRIQDRSKASECVSVKKNN